MIDCNTLEVIAYAKTHRDWDEATEEQRYEIVCSAAVAAMSSEAEMVCISIEEQAEDRVRDVTAQLERARAIAAHYGDILHTVDPMPAGVAARSGTVA